MMFLQFLADRKDADGNAALNRDFFAQRHDDGTLSGNYESFSDVLSTKTDTYRLFRWLNDKFNGDLFPTAAEQRMQRSDLSRQNTSTSSPISSVATFSSAAGRVPVEAVFL